MLMMFDAAEPEGIRVTADGYIVGSARVARTGIQEYLAGELGLTDRDPTDIVRIFRPESTVFSKDAMATYAYRPVTIDHPSELVDADTWKSKASGMTGADVVRDGEFVRVPMALMDKQAIEQWRSGKRELSMGYSAEIEMRDGVTDDGQAYDGVQTSLRMNHLALVARARGGSQLKLGDDKPHEDYPMTDKLKTVTVDGIPVETTDAGATVIARLQKDVSDAQAKLSDVETAHKLTIADKDKEIAAKDAEIDDLKGKVMDASALDAAVKERADLIAVAKSIADTDYAGKAPAEIRKAAVSMKLGDAAVSGKSDEYVAARFDILAEDAAKDPVRKAVQNGTFTTTTADAAYDKMIVDLQTGYQGGAR